MNALTRRSTLLLLLLAGCGRSVTPEAPEANDPSPTSTEQDAGESELPPATADGIISLSHEDGETTLFPLFRNPRLPASTGLPLGECRVFTVEQPADPFVSNTSAGTVLARAGERAITLEYDEKIESYYPSKFPGEGPLPPGSPLEIEASGGDVPAFQTTVQLVGPVRVLTPIDAGITKGAPFSVTWEPTADAVAVGIAIYGAGAQVRCAADGRVGSLEVPAEYVNAAAEKPTSENNLTLDVVVGRTTVVRAGAYEVHVLDNRSSHHANLTIH